jgi:NDP-sugar pyrophosphorylase family protein
MNAKNNSMLNIVIPMAGYGSRFSQAGYTLPKPLIDTKGKPMIEVVLKNLTPATPHRFIIICQNAHLRDYPLREAILEISPTAEIIGIDGVTEGAACTVLLAKQLINNDNPLMIANCDQYVDISIDDYLAAMEKGVYQGFIMTMTADDPKWSFIQYDASGLVNRVVEKQVISNEATVGIYNFSSGKDFVDAAETMIANNDRVNNEFYVAPVYNYLYTTGKRTGYMNIGSERNGMYGLGIPADLEFFNGSSIAI